ncbi:MarR family winged helix-turn-helix transcriptional regulator [Nocardia sp. NPDC051321]|uniref:MarR family winged helix-turn-helix transcriptional regulator n=1 Tax=Nocardia sp. NPDC051321 TaxID=3364323 RepID=UPI0037AC0456
MTDDLDAADVASALLTGVGALLRRLRHPQLADALTMPERTALSRLDREGPATSAELARKEQITPQAMGATLSALQARGLIARNSDPADRRRVVLAVTPAGSRVLTEKRSARAELMAGVLAEEFTPAQLKQLAAAAPLIERLAHHL